MLSRPDAGPGFERGLHRLAHREVGEELGALERAAEAEAGAPGRGETRHIAPEHLDPAPGRHEPARSRS